MTHEAHDCTLNIFNMSSDDQLQQQMEERHESIRAVDDARYQNMQASISLAWAA